ncbi:MAG TPA: hypothetical protein VFP21_08985 [Solirubrobacterales bacterium]|nr:hypothetical protein [Solirubrobacterales bacterium]
MTHTKGRRARLGMTLFALALGALALLAMPSLAAAKDRNHDRIPDRWEKAHKLSLKVNQARLNQDGDKLRNRAEFLAGDNPRDEDSNDDGVMDGADNAGTIASFDGETGRLVINLFGGDTVSGLVTEGTEIECDNHSGASASSDGESGEAEPGDDKGGEGGAEPGDDEGGRGEEEPGDDHGGEEADDDSGSGSESSGPGSGGGSCTTADLTPGAVVHEAELKIESGQATFEKVELSGKDA